LFKEAVERETGILTEVDTYDWITFLPMSDGTGAYNRYFGRLNTGKMKIGGGDGPERGHAGVRQQNAAGGIRGPGREIH
jgi:hypothetical protein